MRSSRVVFGSLALVTLAGCGGTTLDPAEVSATNTSPLGASALEVRTAPLSTINLPVIPKVCIPCKDLRVLIQVPLASVPSGTIVDTYFSGLTFSVVNDVKGQWVVDPSRHVYAETVLYQPPGTAPSIGLTVDPGPYNIGTTGWQPFFNDNDGDIMITFASPVSSVSVNALTIYSGPGGAGTALLGPDPLPFLDAYGTGGSLLNEVVEAPTSAGASVWTTISDAPSSSIGTVIIGPGTRNSNAVANVMFQDLIYSN
jgi:hypothetical protein